MKRGSSLVAALLLIALMLALGIASLTQRVHQNRAAASATQAAQARQLAMAGIADVQAKLQFDLNFPPDRETMLSYTEQVLTLDNSNVIGFYTVTIEGRYAPAFETLRVTSVGRLGDDPEDPLARASIRADFDLAEDRGGSPNTDYFRWRAWRES